MNRGKRIGGISVVFFLLSALPALAAGGRQDNSNLLIFGFLALCALIIICQLVPVFSWLGALFKQSAEADAAEELEPAASKYRSSL